MNSAGFSKKIFTALRSLNGWTRCKLTAALRDWGTGLDLSLYEDAATHFYGGPEQVLGMAEIRDGGQFIGHQPVRLAAPDIAFKITTMHPKSFPNFENHARRFLAHSTLAALQWINISKGQVLFKTLRRNKDRNIDDRNLERPQQTGPGFEKPHE